MAMGGHNGAYEPTERYLSRRRARSCHVLVSPSLVVGLCCWLILSAFTCTSPINFVHASSVGASTPAVDTRHVNNDDNEGKDSTTKTIEAIHIRRLESLILLQDFANETSESDLDRSIITSRQRQLLSLTNKDTGGNSVVTVFECNAQCQDIRNDEKDKAFSQGSVFSFCVKAHSPIGPSWSVQDILSVRIQQSLQQPSAKEHKETVTPRTNRDAEEDGLVVANALQDIFTSYVCTDHCCRVSIILDQRWFGRAYPSPLNIAGTVLLAHPDDQRETQSTDETHRKTSHDSSDMVPASNHVRHVGTFQLKVSVSRQRQSTAHSNTPKEDSKKRPSSLTTTQSATILAFSEVLFNGTRSVKMITR